MAYAGYLFGPSGQQIYATPRESPGRYRPRPLLNREIKRSISQYDHAELVSLSASLCCRIPVLRAAIRDKLLPVEVYTRMRADFPQHAPRDLATWIDRFFKLWCRNQWKRERYAPSFHLDDENLDPKTWCRFPILSGGFRRELAEMQPGNGVVA